MRKKAIIAIISLLCFGQGAWAQELTIAGLTYNKEKGYYEITNAAALNALATYVNNENSVNHKCEGLTFKVTADISFSSSESAAFVPIGNGDEYDDILFAGTFDGQGNTISGIKYSAPKGENIGLFGYISGALIQNVKMENCSFTGNFCVGAIAGFAKGAQDGKDHGIFNCIVGSDVAVTASSVTINSEELPGKFVGGITGDCANTTLSGCQSAATVTGDDYVGGIAGRLISSVKDGKERGVIEDCFFTGSVITETTNKGVIAGTRGPVLGEEQGANTIGLLKLTLLNDDSNATVKNAERIANYNGQKANVTLSGRTLYKDGNWNTLCLPFDVEDANTDDEVTFTGTPLEGATVKKLMSSAFDSEKGELTLNFTEDGSDLTAIEAGTPYIVKWTGTDVSGPVFSGVLINNIQNTTTTTDKVNFVGSFSSVGLNANDKSKLYLGLGDDDVDPTKKVSTLYYPSAAMTIGACRAYFQLKDITAGGTAARAFVLNFGDDEATGIGSTLMSSEKVNNEAWHSLDGRKLNSKPTQKGLYIYKGKKMVVK